MGEGHRLVPLDKAMGEPCRAISGDRRNQDQPPWPGHDAKAQEQQGGCGAGEMNGAGTRIGVLA